MSRCNDQRGLLRWKTDESEKKFSFSFPGNICCADEWNAWVDCRNAGDE